MIARARSTRAYDPIVVNADGDGLGVAEPSQRRMTTCAGVVVVQPSDRVEPQHPSEVGEATIHAPPQPCLQRFGDASGECMAGEQVGQLFVERRIVLSSACLHAHLSRG